VSGASIGVFGGSGFYQWFEDAEEVRIDTPFGAPSGAITLGTVGARRVAFMPRHGLGHKIPAQTVNYRANLWAMRELGVRRLLGPCAVGSLRTELQPGDLVICDQFVDRTSGRQDTFFPGPDVVHVSTADPYCPELRRLAVEAAGQSSQRWHAKGTVVVIQGPRFSTRAESRWFSRMGWDLVGMTQYPEVVLARELEICYLTLALVTDYDAGLEHDPASKAVEATDVVRVLNQNVARVRALLEELIPRIPEQPGCDCRSALRTARL
jgi:5'-methylthioadenosine phosphorylase